VHEKQILKLISHDIPFFPEFVCTFSDDVCLHTLYHFTGVMDLPTLLSENECLKEEQAKFIAEGLVLALNKLHGLGIISRSVVPEAIVLDSKGYPRLLDFRLSKELESDDVATTICGTPDYLAPEIVQPDGKGYDTSADFWALGCMIFEMLVGRSPFVMPEEDVNDVELYQRISSHVIGGLQFPDTVSAEAQDFVQKLMDPSPGSRSEFVRNAKTHQWVCDADWTGLEKSTAESPVCGQDVSQLSEQFSSNILDAELFDASKFSPRDFSSFKGF